MTIDRRQFLQLAALGGGAVFASALPGCAAMSAGEGRDFHFVQLSDCRINGTPDGEIAAAQPSGRLDDAVQFA